MRYKKGDKLIHTKHGTDHSYTDVYYIKEIFQSQLTLSLNTEIGARYIIYRQMLDDDLDSDYPQFEIVSKREQIKLDEELFKL